MPHKIYFRALNFLINFLFLTKCVACFYLAHSYFISCLYSSWVMKQRQFQNPNLSTLYTKPNKERRAMRVSSTSGEPKREKMGWNCPVSVCSWSFPIMAADHNPITSVFILLAYTWSQQSEKNLLLWMWMVLFSLWMLAFESYQNWPVLNQSFSEFLTVLVQIIKGLVFEVFMSTHLLKINAFM